MSATGDGRFPEDASLFEHAPCGLIVSTADGAILRANAAICDWLGYREAELVGQKRVQDLLSIGGRLFFQTHCGPLLSIQGSIAEVQLEILTRARVRLPVLINVVRRKTDDIQYDAWSLVVTSERRAYEKELLSARQKAETSLEAKREAEARLREVNDQLSIEHRRKDEFLATLAHELRNPLAPLRNALEVIRLKQGAGTEPLWGFDIIDRQTRQLTHLVDDLMDVSRITQGRVQLRRTACDLVAIVKAAIADSRSLIEAAGHRLDVDFPPQPVWVDADEVRLTQVVNNLLTNAAKYTPDGGTIAVAVVRHAGEVAVSVKDSGIGIPADALSNVFMMFSQLQPALERSQGGLGIGLALVRGLVELHGGRIRAASAGIGHGSVFIVELPVLEEALAPELPVIAGDSHATRRILVVDDNIDAADTLVMALELHGHSVRAAYNASDALAQAKDFEPSLILLDIGLPDMNGYEVARRIRAEPWGTGITLVAATGWSQEADRQRAHDSGFDDHLVKPIEFARLMELLAKA
ncbi:MAG: ATP-binding protein [Pseudomonadota bacterium]|nr:ATP-binding protein [Pseudomonadota bacterium]